MPKERTDTEQASAAETPPAPAPIPAVAFIVRLIKSLVDEPMLDTSHVSAEMFAEMMTRLLLLASPLQRVAMQSNMSATQTASFFCAQEGDSVGNMPFIAPGQSIRLDTTVYAHKCGKCLQVWTSDQANPVKCPRQAPDKRGPKCGTRRWREVWTADEPSEYHTASDAVIQTPDGQHIIIECKSSSPAANPTLAESAPLAG